MAISKVQGYLLNFLFGALGGVLVLVLKSYTAPVEPPLNFAVVDTQKIIELQFLSSLRKAASNPDAKLNLEEETEEFTHRLLTLINQTSTANNLVLLTPGVSLTELNDLTDQFLKHLKLDGLNNAP